MFLVLDDLFEVVDVGEVYVHRFVEVLGPTRKGLVSEELQHVGEVIAPVEYYPFQRFVQNQS